MERYNLRSRATPRTPARTPPRTPQESPINSDLSDGEISDEVHDQLELPRGRGSGQGSNTDQGRGAGTSTVRAEVNVDVPPRVPPRLPNYVPRVVRPAAANHAVSDEALDALVNAFKSVSLSSRQIPLFDPTTDRINEFLVKFNSCLDGASGSEKISKLAASLKGDALTWYVTELDTAPGKMRTFEEWQELLRKQFSKSSQTLCAELFANRQKSKQTPVEYYHATLRMCSMVDPQMSEQMKLMHLQRGLQQSTLEKIKLMKPKTTSEFLTDLQSLQEEIEEKKDESQQKLIEILTIQLAKEQERKKQEVPILFANTRSERAGARRDCFTCGSPSHFAAACPKNRRQNARYDKLAVPRGFRPAVPFGNVSNSPFYRGNQEPSMRARAIWGAKEFDAREQRDERYDSRRQYLDNNPFRLGIPPRREENVDRNVARNAPRPSTPYRPRHDELAEIPEQGNSDGRG